MSIRVRMHDDEIAIDERLARELIDEEFPAYVGLRLSVVEPWGTDHAIWRLGDELVARFPRIGWARNQVDLEAKWLPRLAPRLPVALPAPVAIGEPALGYPYRWAIHRWLEGKPATRAALDDPVAFALELADVVGALRSLPIADAPQASGRARPTATRDQGARALIAAASNLMDSAAALAVWEAALDAPPHVGDPVWVHGDLDGNCLLRDGHLAGLLDWGSACVGDPAVDVATIWSPLFTAESRDAFVAALDVDEATVARSRGVALEQAAAALPYYLNTYPGIVERARHQLAALGVAVIDSTP